jgi:hypothetical protein
VCRVEMMRGRPIIPLTPFYYTNLRTWNPIYHTYLPHRVLNESNLPHVVYYTELTE